MTYLVVDSLVVLRNTLVGGLDRGGHISLLFTGRRVTVLALTAALGSAGHVAGAGAVAVAVTVVVVVAVGAAVVAVAGARGAELGGEGFLCRSLSASSVVTLLVPHPRMVTTGVVQGRGLEIVVVVMRVAVTVTVSSGGGSGSGGLGAGGRGGRSGLGFSFHGSERG